MKRSTKEYVPNAAAAARRAKARKENQHPFETTETNPDWRKMQRNRPDKDEKHLAYSILIANNVQKEKAATMLGYSEKTVRSLDRAIIKKSLKLELLSEQRINWWSTSATPTSATDQHEDCRNRQHDRADDPLHR